MGMMDRLLNAMRLNNEDYDDEDYDDEMYDDEVEEEIPMPQRNSRKVRDIDDYEERPQRAASSKVTPIRQPLTRKVQAGGKTMEVCVIKPISVEDGREITDTLLSNRTVILNLEGLDIDIAQRIIDFASGSCYAISGNLQKVSRFIFILTPASVGVTGDTGDFQDILNDSFESAIGSGF